MTPNQRRLLEARHNTIERLKGQARVVIDVIKRICAELEEQKDALLEEHAVEIAAVPEGEGCDALILRGELGHHAPDSEGCGPFLCAACAPTFAEELGRLEKSSAETWADPDDHAAAIAKARGAAEQGKGHHKDVWAF